MLERCQGEVTEIIHRRKGMTEVRVKVRGEIALAVNYDLLTGEVEVGDLVELNTGAVTLGLGTGGRHFIMHNAQSRLKNSLPGHIMKLRYTPWQIACLSVEEESSPYRDKITGFKSLNQLPVIVCSLHSMLPLAAAAYSLAAPQKRIAYLMTEGGALPLAFSETAARLKEAGIIVGTVTSGNAFGGDLEAVNNYTGMIAAKEVLQADCIIAGMGPGIAGTGTKYGFSGLEQGELINCVNILGGTPITIPRLGFFDRRARHYGISHHTLTVLSEIALTHSLVVLPKLAAEKRDFVLNQLELAGILQKHSVIEKECSLAAYDYLQDLGIKVTTMGRGINEAKEFFQTCFAAGCLAGERE